MYGSVSLQLFLAAVTGISRLTNMSGLDAASNRELIAQGRLNSTTFPDGALKSGRKQTYLNATEFQAPPSLVGWMVGRWVFSIIEMKKP